MSAGLRLDRIVLICNAPLALARFYERALGFTCGGSRILDEPAFGAKLGLPAARAQGVSLRLGGQHLDLLRIEPAGLPYPQDVPGSNALFQHFAIEVRDLPRAMRRLNAQPGWTAISVGGPQTLPPASGGVTAFKFKDPEGHPLELITPAQPAPDVRRPRITHSAISVASTARSTSFYAQLGLVMTGGSINVGPEQARLDAMPTARVAVTALSACGAPAPHLELLCYGEQSVRPPVAARPNDIAADWLVFSVRAEEHLRSLLRMCAGIAPRRFADGTLRGLLPDPDGHWLCLEAPADGTQPPVANPG